MHVSGEHMGKGWARVLLAPLSLALSSGEGAVMQAADRLCQASQGCVKPSQQIVPCEGEKA